MDPVWGNPAEDFINEILSEAWWAKSELHWQQFDSTKRELFAEHTDILTLLNETHSKLRRLSPDFDRLLGNDADPLGCADQIGKLIQHVENAGSTIDDLPKSRRPVEKETDVAEELALRVLRVLQGYGINLAATGDSNLGYASDAVDILRIVGDDIGLERSTFTWRSVVSKAKKAGLR